MWKLVMLFFNYFFYGMVNKNSHNRDIGNLQTCFFLSFSAVNVAVSGYIIKHCSTTYQMFSAVLALCTVLLCLFLREI